MTLISTVDLRQHLESIYAYQVVGIIDLDQLVSQSRNTLYRAFRKWHKDVFAPDEKIVLYSRESVSVEMLSHIQKCSSLVDISNFFILICSPEINNDHLEFVKTQYSYDDTIFSTLPINFTDLLPSSDQNNLFVLPESFCFSPWAHLEINSVGEFKPCCVFNESIKDHNDQPYNINKDSINDVYNSDYLKKLRTQFINGKKPNGCSNCWYKEEIHGISNRMWTATHLGLNAQCLDIEQDSVSNLISLDIKLGNLCNFKCRICDPTNSSKIAEEYLKHFNSTIDIKKINSRGQWTTNSQIWKMFEQVGNQLVNIDFYGGEPLLVKQHEIFLDYLIAHDYAKNIRLHYNSNGSIYPDHLLEKWKLFKEVDIGFSIDNIGQRFELERGSSWDKVENNLNNFLKHKSSNMVLNIFTTINVQNIYYLDELIDWVETKDFNALHFNILDKPEYFRINAMGAELTTLVINKLSQIVPSRLKKYNIYPILKSLELTNNSNNSIDKLSKYMLKLDNIRNQQFTQTHPEIAGIIYKGK